MAQVGSLVLLTFVVREVLSAFGSLAHLLLVYVDGGSQAVWWGMGVGSPVAGTLVFATMLVWVALVATQRPPDWAGGLPVTLAAILALLLARLTLSGSELAQGMLLTRHAVAGKDVEAFYMARSAGWTVAQVLQGMGVSAALVVFAFRRHGAGERPSGGAGA